MKNHIFYYLKEKNSFVKERCLLDPDNCLQYQGTSVKGSLLLSLVRQERRVALVTQERIQVQLPCVKDVFPQRIHGSLC